MSTDDLFNALSTIYAHWCDVHQLPHYSADELLFSENLTALQREWLNAFVILWETVETMV